MRYFIVVLFLLPCLGCSGANEMVEADARAGDGGGPDGGGGEINFADSVAVGDITWNFDKEYRVGKFANGDPWVAGEFVVITRITPDFDGYDNGWEVNPVVSGPQGFQDGCSGGGFDPALVPDLPYTAQGPVSIVKTTPTGSERPCIDQAAVLTVLPEIPPQNGEAVFRPPYVGDEKPFYFVDDLRLDSLPAYEPAGNPPELGYIEEAFTGLRLDHKTGVLGRSLRPVQSMADYQPKNTPDINNGVLRLMLDDPVEEKMGALIQYVQAGIDKVHTILLGQTWPAGGGHQPGHIVAAAFTATMLDMTEVKSFLKEASFFHASTYLFSKTTDGVHLWGQENSEDRYWTYIESGSGSRSNRDPYGYIDGGECGAAYQLITSQSHKGEVLAAVLMDSLLDAWPADDFEYAENYVRRWVDEGVWAQPDPCAPYDGNPGNRGIAYGPDPDNPSMCITDPGLEYYDGPDDFAYPPGIIGGRFPEKHGTNKDDGQYRSEFVAAMWEKYY